MQIKGREGWYEARWAAVDQPEWNKATFIRSQQVTPTMRLVVLEIEISREKIALRNAYKHVGQTANLRVNGLENIVTVANSPYSQQLNKLPLFSVRGDLFAGEIKFVKEDLLVKTELEVLVTEEEAPDVYNLVEGVEVEVGPFVGEGINLRGDIAGIYRYPTIVIFCEGEGIATAKALIECPSDVVSLNLPYRTDARLYYKAPNQDSLAFQDMFESWEKMGCKVITTTGTFQEAFDDDDTLVYEPELTAAVILVGGDEEAEKKALAVCKEAEISEVVKSTDEMPAPIYCETGLKQI
eukprot:evm.model.scf_636EXC.6 EVM.evm.TU.scf_636EXC.6   scf_636EXC:40187-44945(+)